MTDRHDPKNLPEEGAGPSEQGKADLGRYEEAMRLGTGRVAARAAEILEEIDRAAALLDDLLAKSAPERRRFVEQQFRFRALLLAELVLDRCRAAFFSDPAAAVELGELAVMVAGRLDTGHYGESLAENARARAWAHLANARRISSDLRGAEEALRTAEEHHVRAGEDAYTGAEILSFKASLLNAHGRYEEAASALDPVIEVYREAKDRHLEGRALIFESRDDQQKAMAAFVLFRQAAEAEQVTAALVQEVANSLEKVRRSVERA